MSPSVLYSINNWQSPLWGEAFLQRGHTQKRCHCAWSGGTHKFHLPLTIIFIFVACSSLSDRVSNHQWEDVCHLPSSSFWCICWNLSALISVSTHQWEDVCQYLPSTSVNCPSIKLLAKRPEQKFKNIQRNISKKYLKGYLGSPWKPSRGTISFAPKVLRWKNKLIVNRPLI